MVPMLMSPAGTLAADETTTVPERGAIEEKYRWSTETIFSTTEAWETEFAAVAQRVDGITAFRGTLGSSADKLLDFLKYRDETESRIERVAVYASLLADQDTRNGAMQAMDSRARTLGIRYGEATSWVRPELIAIPFEKIDSWMREKPDLGSYRQWFDDLFRTKKHILSPREEQLMAMTGELRSTPYNAYNLLSNADIQFPTIKNEEGRTVELDDSAFYLYMRSPDRRVRKDAYEAIVGTHARHKNAAGALLNGAVQSHVLEVKARGYESCLAAALDDSNIPVEVYQTLVRTINRNARLLHRYEDLRKRALKLDDGVHAYDLFAPLVTGQKLAFSYEQAVDVIETALQPLGPEYITQMMNGFGSRWVDVYPTKGKRSGAYSSGTYLTQPYILANFHGGYEDVSTLAHEMGHSMHSHLSRTTQPYVYGDYDIFCAEVASTCNEILLQHDVLEQTRDPKKRLYLLGEFLEGMRGTVFRQTMFSEFEQRIHEMAEKGEPLTADSLSAAYHDIMTRYYGPSYVNDDLVDKYWVRIPHFYYNFYVYKYATSYCAASNIARRIMDEEPGARDKYLTFLKSGSSAYPVELLQRAGVDMTSPQPYEDAMKLFENLLDQTEALLKQLGML